MNANTIQKPNSKKEKGFFPTNIFGKCKDTTDSKTVIEKVKNELEEKKNYKPELTIYERAELGKELIKCIQKNNEKKVKKLIKMGADLNVQDDEGDTALIMSSRKRNTVISQMLINKGANLNVQNTYGWTALIFAVNKGDIEITKFLIENGVDLNVQDDEKNTALIWAVRKNNTKLSTLLIEKGADVNAKGEYGRTSLMWALREANIEIAELLIERGADLNLQDSEGKTVLMCASWGGTRSVLLLLQYPEIKLDMEILTKEFTKASDRGDLKLVKELLPKVDVNAISHEGRNGLILASRHNYLDCVSVILNDSRTDVNIKDSVGNTALMYAAESGYTDVVSLLLQHPKIDVNIKDDNGQTALVEAVYKEYYDIVSLLIDKGANISSLDCLFRVNFKNSLKYVIKKFEEVLV